LNEDINTNRGVLLLFADEFPELDAALGAISRAFFLMTLLDIAVVRMCGDGVVD